jgi:hypothetical protein
MHQLTKSNRTMLHPLTTSLLPHFSWLLHLLIGNQKPFQTKNKPFRTLCLDGIKRKMPFIFQLIVGSKRAKCLRSQASCIAFGTLASPFVACCFHNHNQSRLRCRQSPVSNLHQHQSRLKLHPIFKLSSLANEQDVRRLPNNGELSTWSPQVD